VNGPPRPVLKDWPILLIGAAGLIAIVWIVVTYSAGSTVGTASARALSISNGTATLLEVNPLVTLGTKAPPFTLIDQNGKRTTLGSFAGKAVVLTFGDDKCADLCTLLAQDVLAADKDLGGAKKNVQFVSINANPFYPTIASTKSWSDEHGLGNTANWHFLTGGASTLAALAKKYGVEVQLDHKDRTIVHGTNMFFIDPAGDEVQIGQFGVESANTSLFAHAMAQLAVQTLPAAMRTDVAGPSMSAPSTASTVLGATPAPVELARVGGGPPINTASYRGKYLVLNFWASTCPICTRELPAIQKVDESGDKNSVIVGVDVSDPATAATTFIKRAGTSYPMLADSSGVAAGQFQIPGLPYTVILSPKGSVVVRHPGAITTEQLEYLLQTLETESPNG
jgi:cytochrome oxidase Cu insertion factor (SCO1/SenC/PrrC family)